MPVVVNVGDRELYRGRESDLFLWPGEDESHSVPSQLVRRACHGCQVPNDGPAAPNQMPASGTKEPTARRQDCVLHRRMHCRGREGREVSVAALIATKARFWSGSVALVPRNVVGLGLLEHSFDSSDVGDEAGRSLSRLSWAV